MPTTTTSTPAGWSPDQVEFVPGDIVPGAIIRQAATVVGQIEGDQPSIRVPFMEDDGTAGFIAEGEPIADADQTPAEAVITTGKIATVGKYSRELLAQEDAARMVAESLSRAVVTKANEAFLANAASPTGVLHNAQITDGGTVGDNLDTLTDAVAGIEADGGQATHVIASPAAWATIAKIKAGEDSAQALLGAGTEDTERRILGIPVLVTPSMPAEDLLVVDSAAIVAAEGPVHVDRSEHAFFASDVIAVRVSWRIGWEVMRPARIAAMTTDPES